MRPGRFSTDFCENMLLFAKQNEKTMDMRGLRALVQRIRQGAIHFALPDGLQETESIRNYDVTQYGSMRPPYSMVVIELITHFLEGDQMPTVIIAMDMPEEKEVWWTYSLKELAPSKIDPTKTIFAWRVTPYFWRLPYEHCGKFDAEGNPQFIMSPGVAISQDVHEELFRGSGMTDEEYKDKHATAAHIFMEVYAGFCGAIYGHEVTFTDVEPNEASNKMRRARGKMPLFSYKTLTIGKPKRKSRHLGGTHASPRSHLRRGHYRTSQKGVRHWVQPCMIKGETDGFVHKDYIVEVEAA